MTFNLFCSWADYCASKEGTIEANSYNELFEEMQKFFEEACGFTGVESFEISSPYLEKGEEDNEEGDELYEWDCDNLKRNQNLADVWNKVKREIKEEFGKDYFSENQK
jgi:bisphosphoglycerate-dependent phosphoglycerate mutase